MEFFTLALYFVSIYWPYLEKSNVAMWDFKGFFDKTFCNLIFSCNISYFMQSVPQIFNGAQGGMGSSIKIELFHRLIYPGENHEKPGIGYVC